MTYKKTADVKITDKIVEVEYVFYPAVQETFHSPSEPADIEVLSVSYKGVRQDSHDLNIYDWEAIKSTIYCLEGLL